MTAINYYHDIRLILYAVFLYAGVSVTRSFQEVMCRTFFMSRVAIMCGTLFDLLTQGEVIYAMVSHVAAACRLYFAITAPVTSPASLCLPCPHVLLMASRKCR